MVTRVNGGVYQGVWVEKDVKFLQITSTSATYLTDLKTDESVAQKAEAVNSDLEIVLELVAQRGTILGVNVTSDTVVEVMVGYAGAYTVGNTQATDPSVEKVLSEDIIAETAATVCAIAVFAGFGGALPGTPA